MLHKLPHIIVRKHYQLCSYAIKYLGVTGTVLFEPYFI
jgi:hypothetical protein